MTKVDAILVESEGPIPLLMKSRDGAAPLFNTPEMPNFQAIYFMPEGDPRREQDDKSMETRRRADARSAASMSLHGKPPKKRIRHRGDTEESPVLAAKERAPQKIDRSRLYAKMSEPHMVGKCGDKPCAPCAERAREKGKSLVKEMVGFATEDEAQSWVSANGLSSVSSVWCVNDSLSEMFDIALGRWIPIFNGATLRKSDKPPAGFQAVGKKGGYKKMIGGKWIYWYPGQPHPKAAVAEKDLHPKEEALSEDETSSLKLITHEFEAANAIQSYEEGYHLDIKRAVTSELLPNETAIEWRKDVLSLVQAGDEVSIGGTWTEEDRWAGGHVNYWHHETGMHRLKVTQAGEGGFNAEDSSGQRWHLRKTLKRQGKTTWTGYYLMPVEWSDGLKKWLPKQASRSVDVVQRIEVHTPALRDKMKALLQRKLREELPARAAREAERAKRAKQQVADYEMEQKREAEYERYAEEERKKREVIEQKSAKEHAETVKKVPKSPYSSSAESRRYNKGVAWTEGRIDDPQRLMSVAARKADADFDAKNIEKTRAAIQKNDPFWLGVFNAAHAHTATKVGKKKVAEKEERMSDAQATAKKLAKEYAEHLAAHDKKEALGRIAAGLEWAKRKELSPESARKIAHSKVKAGLNKVRMSSTDHKKNLGHVLRADPFWGGVYRHGMEKSHRNLVFYV